MKDPLNLSGIEEPDPSWWDDLRFGLWPMVVVVGFLLCAGAFFLALLN